MVSPQLENGYCSIATELIDKFCSYRLSGEEWLVLWAIFRKTYCWHKKEDRIAISTFAVMTGLKRPTVQRALRKLESKKIIENIKNDTRQPNLYRFNKHFDTWNTVSKKMPPASKKILSNIKKDTGVESKKRHSIDTISKDTIQNIDTELAILLRDKIKENIPTLKEPNIESWAKEIEKMRRIDKRTPIQIKYLIEWCQKNTFWQANILSTSKLREKFDSLTAQVKKDYQSNQSNSIKFVG